jgi:hypothetical protein
MVSTLVGIAGILLVFVVTLFADRCAQTRRRRKWVRERMHRGNAVTDTTYPDADRVRQQLCQAIENELSIPSGLITADDTVAALCDLGMEPSDMVGCVNRQFGLQLKCRDLCKCSPMKATTDAGDISITIGKLAETIANGLMGSGVFDSRNTD